MLLLLSADFFKKSFSNIIRVLNGLYTYGDQHYVDVPKLRSLVDYQKGKDNQCTPRSSLIRLFLIYCYDKYFVNFSPDNQHYIENRKQKVFELLENVRNDYFAS